MGTDKYHIQVSHHLRVGKNALNEYDQYAIYLAILYHGAIRMVEFNCTLTWLVWAERDQTGAQYCAAE